MPFFRAVIGKGLRKDHDPEGPLAMVNSVSGDTLLPRNVINSLLLEYAQQSFLQTAALSMCQNIPYRFV